MMLPVSTEGSHRRKAIDSALVKMIALDLQPSSITEDRGFQSFVKILDPKYIPPSRRTIMRDLLPPLYEASTQELARLLAECDYCAITTDLWTSCTTTGYLTLTCHFFTKLWELRSYVLETVHIDVSHTAENIAAALVAAARKWNIMDKISCAVTDNAANIVAAIRIAGWSHLPCFAHTINLIVTNSISEVPELEELIKSCKDIVSYFHKSSKATDKLQSIQTRMNIPNHKLIQQVDTRWNSVFYMIERMVEQDEAVRTTLCLLNRNDIIMTTESIDVLKNVIEVLRPFEAVTREMSADKYVSISKIIPLSRSLQRLTTIHVGIPGSLCDKLSSRMRRTFLNMEDHNILSSGTILDPRLKKIAFTDGSFAEKAVSQVVNEALLHRSGLR